MAEDLSRPAFRYSSSGRRPERLNQSRGVNAPLQLLRGWAAGTLGLPGDIEGLVRMLPGIKDETPVLPTSDFYREWLPGYDERPAARAMSGLGALTGGMGATNVARAGLGAVKRATDVNAIRDYVRSAQGVSGMPGTAAVGGAVAQFLRSFFKTEEPLDKSRRLLLGARELEKTPPGPVSDLTQSAAESGRLERLAQSPVSRRQVLKAAGAQAARAVLPAEASAPLKEIATQLVAPAEPAAAGVGLYALTPEVKTGALNMLARVGRANNAPPGIDRAAMLAQVIPENMNLKEFMRQVKTEPDVYKTLMNDLETLGREDRAVIGSGASKEDYLRVLSDLGASEAARLRESRLWDKYNGEFEMPKRFTPENPKPRLFDKDLGNPEWFDQVHSSIRDELAEQLAGLPYDKAQSALKAFKKEFGPQLKAQSKEREDYFFNLAKEKTGLSQPVPPQTLLLSGVDWKNPPPLQKLFSHSARGLAPLSEVNRFFRGSGPPMTQAEYDAAVNQLREILPKTVYQPGPGVDKLYRDLGLAVPEYTPTEKTQLRVLREPEEPGFARGGAVTAPPGPAQYDPLAIDSLAEQLLMEA